MTMYSIGEFGKQIGVTLQTLRNWDKKGELKPAHVSQGVVLDIILKNNEINS